MTTTSTSSPMTGFSHVQLLVTDPERSELWYSTTLGMTRMAASAEKGYVALQHGASGVVIVLSRGRPDENDGGVATLDHLAFAVPDGDSLEAWAEHLTAAGVTHPGVVLELGKPSLQLRDPDGIAIELVAPAGR